MQNNDHSNHARFWPRVIFSATILTAAVTLLGTYLCLLAFSWGKARLEVTQFMQQHWWFILGPLLLLWTLIGITIADLFKTRGNVQRTWELAFFVVLITVIAIIWYWSQQLSLALRGNARNGLVFRFSFRTVFIAFVIWSVMLATLVNLFRSLTSK